MNFGFLRQAVGFFWVRENEEVGLAEIAKAISKVAMNMDRDRFEALFLIFFFFLELR